MNRWVYWTLAWLGMGLACGSVHMCVCARARESVCVLPMKSKCTKEHWTIKHWGSRRCSLIVWHFKYLLKLHTIELNNQWHFHYRWTGQPSRHDNTPGKITKCAAKCHSNRAHSSQQNYYFDFVNILNSKSHHNRFGECWIWFFFLPNFKFACMRCCN